MEKSGQVHIETRDFNSAIEVFGRLAAFESTHPGAKRASEQLIGIATRFKRLRMLFFLSLAISMGAFAFWLGNTRWKQVGKKQIVGGLVDIAVLSPVILGSLIYVMNKPRIYWFSLMLLWVVSAAAAFCNHLYISTNKFGTAARFLLTFALIFVAGAFVYAVYYQTDLINLLYDSLQYSLSRGGA